MTFQLCKYNLNPLLRWIHNSLKGDEFRYQRKSKLEANLTDLVVVTAGLGRWNVLKSPHVTDTICANNKRKKTVNSTIITGKSWSSKVNRVYDHYENQYGISYGKWSEEEADGKSSGKRD